MANPIVTLAVSIQDAPAPSNLQRTGAFISQGATTAAPGSRTFLASVSDLATILKPAAALTSLAWASSVVTAVTAVAHGVPSGTTFWVRIAAAAPAGYNGAFLATSTGGSGFTYALAANPGAETSPGTYQFLSAAQLSQMNATFFGMGTGPGVYVLELGYGDDASGPLTLGTWIQQNPGVFYGFLVPRYWDASVNYLALIAQYTAPTAKLYYFTTTNLANYLSYPVGDKDVFKCIEAPNYGTWPANALTALSQTGGVASATTTTAHGIQPGQWFQLSGNLPSGWNGWWHAQLGTTGSTLVFTVPSTLGAETQLGTVLQNSYASPGIMATEFSCAAMFWRFLNYNPGPTNKVTPFNLGFLFGVTPFPTDGNTALLTILDAANVNVVGTGAQGGISTSLVQGGNFNDGKPVNYWYSVDWVQVQTYRALYAYLINGSNDPTNPVDYNQPGINGGQTVLGGVMQTGLTDGLVLNNIKLTQLDALDYTAALDANTFAGLTVVNADPFASYTAEEPDDYAAGIYNGYSINYTPLRGFAAIQISIVVSSFAGG